MVIPFVNNIYSNAVAEIVLLSPCCSDEVSVYTLDESEIEPLFCPKCENAISNSEGLPAAFDLHVDEDLQFLPFLEKYNDIFDSILIASSLQKRIAELTVNINTAFYSLGGDRAPDRSINSLKTRAQIARDNILRNAIRTVLKDKLEETLD